MKQFTVEDLKIDSIWQNKVYPEWKVRIDDIDRLFVYYTLIQTPAVDAPRYLGKKASEGIESFLNGTTLVYTVEGFEV